MLTPAPSVGVRNNTIRQNLLGDRKTPGPWPRVWTRTLIFSNKKGVSVQYKNRLSQFPRTKELHPKNGVVLRTNRRGTTTTSTNNEAKPSQKPLKTVSAGNGGTPGSSQTTLLQRARAKEFVRPLLVAVIRA